MLTSVLHPTDETKMGNSSSWEPPSFPSSEFWRWP